MASQELLFSLLQFVALVVPALAILMQVLDNRDGVDPEAFRLLEGGLTLMVFGGIIIGGQLLNTISEISIVIGTISIFVAMIFAILAIWWRSLPISFNQTGSSITGVFNMFKKLMYFMVIISFTSVFYLLPPYYLGGFLDKTLDIGPIRLMEQFSPSMFFTAAFSLLILRVVIYVVNTGINEISTDHFGSMVGISLGLLLAFPVFSAPSFILFKLLLLVPSNIADISPSNPIFLIPYLWSFFVLVVLFIVSIADEEDQEKQ